MAAILLFLAAAIAACLAALIISLLKIREEVKRREEIRGDTEERICTGTGFTRK